MTKLSRSDLPSKPSVHLGLEKLMGTQSCKLTEHLRTGSKVIKKISCSSQLSMKLKMPMNIEIAKIDGIFSFIPTKPVIYPADKC